MIREEVKVLLRDWMTSTTQLIKVHNQHWRVDDISAWWRSNFGLRMSDKWVEKALYGKTVNKGLNNK